MLLRVVSERLGVRELNSLSQNRLLAWQAFILIGPHQEYDQEKQFR
jgi:hypothetical protein